jgi:plastocyanin
MARVVVASLAVWLCAAVGCTQDPVDAAEENVVGVTISTSDFSPKDLSIKVGQTVRWTFAGGNHNIVSGKDCMPDDAFRSGAPQPGGTFEKRFEKAGTFDYFCEVHCTAGGVGQVTVQP